MKTLQSRLFLLAALLVTPLFAGTPNFFTHKKLYCGRAFAFPVAQDICVYVSRTTLTAQLSVSQCPVEVTRPGTIPTCGKPQFFSVFAYHGGASQNATWFACVLKNEEKPREGCASHEFKLDVKAENGKKLGYFYEDNHLVSDTNGFELN